MDKLKFGLVWIVMLLSGCTQYYHGPKTDHFDGTRFYNQTPIEPRGFLDLLRWHFSRERQVWPQHVVGSVDEPPSTVMGKKMRASVVGHATVLVQVDGLNILTDPIWSERASPLSWYGPKRVHQPGISFDQLPKIDIVLVSHNHYDHLNLETLQRLWQRDKPLIVTPLGNETIMQSAIDGIAVQALDWGDEKRITPSVSVFLEPAQHWSARGFFDRNRALWGAFVVKTPAGALYFAGDTGYGPHFKETAKKHGPFRLALLPVGSYTPRWFMKDMHMNPKEAVDAFADLGQPPTLGIHFCTFQLSDEAIDKPQKDLQTALAAHKISPDRFKALEGGQSWWVP